MIRLFKTCSGYPEQVFVAKVNYFSVNYVVKRE